MKKSILAFAAAASVVALTGSGASAFAFGVAVNDVSSAASKVNVRVFTAKPGCNVAVNVKEDDMNIIKDTVTDTEGITVSNTTRGTGVAQIGANGKGSVAIKVAKAGEYTARGTIKFTKLACLDASGSEEWSDQFTVGTEVYVGDYDDAYLEIVNADRGIYKYQLNGDVAKVKNDFLAAGVGVELWVENFSGNRWVKLKTTKTNSIGEFEFKGSWTEGAHDSNDYQIRITRDAKFFERFPNDGGYYINSGTFTTD